MLELGEATALLGKQQCLYFFPLPHGHCSLRPVFVMERRLVNAAAIYFQHIKPFVLASQLDCCLPEKKHAPDFLFNIYEFIFLIIRKMKKRFSADFPAFHIFATNSRNKTPSAPPVKIGFVLASVAMNRA